MRAALTSLALALFTSACLPVVAGGLIYKSTKSGQQKQEFMEAFQRTNMEREARGLEPLDWCSEAYRFDKGWATEDDECAERIRRYEAGDRTALDLSRPPVVPDTTGAQ